METIKLDLIPGKKMPSLHASQYDDGRDYHIDLTENRVPYTLDGTEVLSLEIRKCDNTLCTMDIANSFGDKTYLEFRTTEQMNACAGFNYGEIKLEKNGVRIGSLNFYLQVEGAPDEGGITSQSEINNLNRQITDEVDRILPDMVDEVAEPIINEKVPEKVAELVPSAVETEVGEIVPPLVNELVPQAVGDNYYNKTQTDQKFALISSIKDVTSVEEIAFTQGQYIPTPSSGINPSNPTINASYSSAVVSCQSGDKFLIKGMGASSAYAYCFADDTGNRIYPYETTCPDLKVVTTPAFATKLILNRINVHGGISYKGQPVDDSIEQLNANYERITGVEKIELILNAFIRTSNATVDVLTPEIQQSLAYAVVPCQAGDKFTVKGTGASYAYVYCFINDAGTKLASAQTVSTETVIEAPTGATKLVLNFIVLYDYCAYKGVILPISINALSGSISSQWAGKTVATFGDSITWYDGHEFGPTHSEAGQTAVGYQQYLREIGINITNKGVSGYRMDQILTEVKKTTIGQFDAVTITCGANDFRYPITEPLGTIAPIGSTFDEGTMIGALQSAIEWIIAAKPSIRIILMTPIKGWSNGSVMPETYPQAFLDVGKLYSLPVCDWYHQSGINDLNKTTFIGDDSAQTGYNLHPTNAGFKLMGEMLKGFFKIR